jgi:hypothetical protein
MYQTLAEARDYGRKRFDEEPITPIRPSRARNRAAFEARILNEEPAS